MVCMAGLVVREFALRTHTWRIGRQEKGKNSQSGCWKHQVRITLKSFRVVRNQRHSAARNPVCRLPAHKHTPKYKCTHSLTHSLACLVEWTVFFILSQQEWVLFVDSAVALLCALIPLCTRVHIQANAAGFVSLSPKCLNSILPAQSAADCVKSNGML